MTELGVTKDELDNVDIAYSGQNIYGALFQDAISYFIALLVLCGIAIWVARVIKGFINRNNRTTKFSGYLPSGVPNLINATPIAPLKLDEILPRVLQMLESKDAPQLWTARSDDAEFTALTAKDQSQLLITNRKFVVPKQRRFSINAFVILIMAGIAIYAINSGIKSAPQPSYSEFLNDLRYDPTYITKIVDDNVSVSYTTADGKSYELGIDTALSLIPQLREWGVSDETLNNLKIEYVDRDRVVRQAILYGILVIAVLLGILVLTRRNAQKLTWGYSIDMEPVIVLSLLSSPQSLEGDLRKLAEQIKSTTPEFTAQLSEGRILLVYPNSDRKLDIIYKSAPSHDMANLLFHNPILTT
jgi:hypothetical protein